MGIFICLFHSGHLYFKISVHRVSILFFLLLQWCNRLGIQCLFLLIQCSLFNAQISVKVSLKIYSGHITNNTDVLYISNDELWIEFSNWIDSIQCSHSNIRLNLLALCVARSIAAEHEGITNLVLYSISL